MSLAIRQVTGINSQKVCIARQALLNSQCEVVAVESLFRQAGERWHMASMPVSRRFKSFTMCAVPLVLNHG